MKERFLGAGLSNRARYANDSGGCASARCRAQGIERRRRVADQHMGMIDRPTDNRARRAGGKGLPDKAVPVSRLTGQSDKKIAGADFATVESDAGNNEWRRGLATSRSGYLRGSQGIRHAAHYRAPLPTPTGNRTPP